MSVEFPDDKRSQSFEVVEVSSLPPIDRANLLRKLSTERACGCEYCDADWPGIASASVLVFEEGIDVLDEGAVKDRARTLGLKGQDVGWLLSLFGPEPITYLRQGDQFAFKDGRHRLHALRMAEVERVVVYTGRGGGVKRT